MDLLHSAWLLITLPLFHLILHNSTLLYHGSISLYLYYTFLYHAWLYFTVLDSTLPYHGSTSLYMTLHYSTIALLHSTLLYITLSWLYFTLHYTTMALLRSTLLYITLLYGSTSLYFTLHYSTMALLQSTLLHHGSFGCLKYAFEWFESRLNGLNLNSNCFNSLRLVQVYIRMLRILIKRFEFAFECFKSRSNSSNLHSNG